MKVLDVSSWVNYGLKELLYCCSKRNEAFEIAKLAEYSSEKNTILLDPEALLVYIFLCFVMHFSLFLFSLSILMLHAGMAENFA